VGPEQDEIQEREQVTVLALRRASMPAQPPNTKCTSTFLAGREALRLQFPIFDIQSLLVTADEHISWRERIKASFGYDPLICPRYNRTLELVEIWGPKRGHIWMKC